MSNTVGNVKVNGGICIWTINDFQKLTHENGEPIFSPNFYVTTDSTYEWYLRLYPRGETSQCNDKLSLSFFLWNGSDVSATFKFALVKSNGEKYNLQTMENQIFKTGNNWGYHNFISRDDLLDKNTLRIYCEICEINGLPTTRQIPLCTLNDDIENLLKNAEHSDVDLVVAGQKLPAHKTILAARSSVFAAMFKYENENRKLNCIEITDIEPETAKEMLTYIYTDKAPNLKKMSSDLLAAAGKFNLERLKAMCSGEQLKNLSIANAADTLILADRYGAEELKTKVVAFINENKTEVKTTQGWQKIIKSHTHLLIDLY